MNLYLLRNIYTDHSTRGIIISNYKFLCYTLEDVVRTPSIKIDGETAIAAGRYEVILSYSNRFKRTMPLLLDVPQFSGIRIHGGNTHKNTQGCLLVAYNAISDDMIQGTAEKDITALLQTQPDEKHWIEIVNTFPYQGIL